MTTDSKQVVIRHMFILVDWLCKYDSNFGDGKSFSTSGLCKDKHFATASQSLLKNR